MDRFQLPAELTIYSAADTARALVGWLSGRDGNAPHLHVAADQVLDIDGAGLQLLLALQKTCVARGQALHLIEPSGTLEKACRALGLDDLLATPSNGACA